MAHCIVKSICFNHNYASTMMTIKRSNCIKLIKSGIQCLTNMETLTHISTAQPQAIFSFANADAVLLTLKALNLTKLYKVWEWKTATLTHTCTQTEREREPWTLKMTFKPSIKAYNRRQIRMLACQRNNAARDVVYAIHIVLYCNKWKDNGRARKKWTWTCTHK